MKCPKCQKNNLSWADYCVSCGSRLTPIVVSRRGPPAESSGLPEIRQHMEDMAIRLSKVEGQVTLISRRIGLESVDAQPAVGTPAEAPMVGLQPEVVGESSPVEVLGAERLPPAVPCAPPVSSKVTEVASLMESTAVVEKRIGEEDAEVGAEAPVAGEVIPVETVAAESILAETRKPGQKNVEAGPPEPATPEVPTPPPAVQPPVVLEAPVSPSFADLRAETPAVTQTAAGKPAIGDSKSGQPVRARPFTEKTPVKVSAATARPAQEPPKPREPSQFGRSMREWEQAMPGNWLSRIGIVALFIGLGFLAKLAYDRDWIGPVAQLLAGLGCGGVLLLAGHHWRKVYRGWAQAVTGGGVAVLYLSVFASYALHVGDPAGPVMPFWATFVSMFLVTALAVGIALRRDSMSIGIIGIVGAFLVPVTLGAIRQSAGDSDGGGSDTPLLIAYVLTLDAGVVWLASLRNWRWFTLLGFIGSMAIFSLWYSTSEREGVLVAAEGMLTGIFLCFAAATTLFHGLWRHRPQLTDLALMTVNAAVYFGVSHYLMWEDYQAWLGALGFGLAAFYAVLGYLFLKRSKENSLLSAFAFGIAITFLTVAIPVQLEKSYMTAAWAAEGAVLIWLAVRYGTPRWQLWGLGAFSLVLVKLFAFDTIVDRAEFTPVMNNMFWAFAPGVVAFYAAAWFLREKDKALQPWFFPVIMLLASVLTMWLFSFEIINFAGSRMIEARVGEVAGYDFRVVENARNLALVALWGAYGLSLAFAGARKGWVWLRLGGYALVGMAVAATLVELNYLHAMIRTGVSNPVANYGFGALAVCVTVLGLIAVIMKRYAGKLTEGERAAFPFVVSLASILSVYALSAEVFTFVDDPLNARNLVVVALWAAYGLGVMMVGLWRGWGWLRVQGWMLAVMAVGMTMMTLNYGLLFMLEAPAIAIGNYSFGAFAICISMLGTLAWMVAAWGKRVHPAERSAFAVLVSAVSVLVVYALSAEVVTFVDGSVDVRNLVLVALWGGCGLGIVVAGLWRGWGWLRVQGWLLSMMAIGATVTALNYGQLLMRESPVHPVWNLSFAAFAICAGMVSTLAWLIAGNRKRFDAGEAVFFPALVLLANFLVLWAASSEIVTFVDGSANARNIALVCLWCGYGLGLLVGGIRKDWDWMRMAGYLVAAVTTGATLIMLNHGQAGVRSGDYMPILNPSLCGFAVCILGLYLHAYVVARNRERLHDFEKVVCIVALTAANLLTMWVLSEEVMTFLAGNAQNLMLVALWLGYGCLLLVLGVTRKALLPRLGACALMAMGIGATAILLNHWSAHIDRGYDWPILNYSFGAFAVCVFACYLFAYVTAGRGEKPDRLDQVVRHAALALASLLTIWAVSGEVATFVVDENLRNLVLVAVWSGYGLILMLAGAWKGIPAARFAGYALVTAAVAMTTTLLNHSHAAVQSSNSDPVINPSFGGFLVCVTALYAAAYLLARNSSRLLDGERVVLTVLIVAANVLSLVALSWEVWTYAGSYEGRNMGLTVLWAAYGLAMMVVGILGRWSWVRLGGLALVSVAILKLFMWDMFSLGGGYRVAAYISVGVLLLTGGFVYHRYADVIKGFIMDRPEKGVDSARR